MTWVGRSDRACGSVFLHVPGSRRADGSEPVFSPYFSPLGEKCASGTALSRGRIPSGLVATVLRRFLPQDRAFLFGGRNLAGLVKDPGGPVEILDQLLIRHPFCLFVYPLLRLVFHRDAIETGDWRKTLPEFLIHRKSPPLG